MSLEDLGNIGEFVAAVAVVVSLIYLAVQIRQNTQQIKQSIHSVKASTFQASLNSAAGFIVNIAQDPDLADIYRRGLRGESLHETEWIRFRFVMSNLFGHYEHLYYQHRAGLAEPELWESRAANMEWYFAQPGWRSYWNEAGRLFGRGFREYVTEHLAGQPAVEENEARRP
jgi:hypothetical protein